MDIGVIIQVAKLGLARKDAQVDTCSVFAAALYDVLTSQGVACQIVTAVKDRPCAWAHSVVEVAGRYYDSMGEFSTEIYRTRARIYPMVDVDIQYRADSRHDCYESDFEEMYIFYVKMLDKAMRGQVDGL
jgi:hypothetical protein